MTRHLSRRAVYYWIQVLGLQWLWSDAAQPHQTGPDPGSLLHPPQHQPAKLGIAPWKLRSVQILWVHFVQLPNLHNYFTESDTKTMKTVKINSAISRHSSF